MLYKCDRCPQKQELDQNKVKDKQYYTSPRGCCEGDYWSHTYYFFTCNCGRDIEVDKAHLTDLNKIPEDFSEHRGVCTDNIKDDIKSQI